MGRNSRKSTSLYSTVSQGGFLRFGGKWDGLTVAIYTLPRDALGKLITTMDLAGSMRQYHAASDEPRPEHSAARPNSPANGGVSHQFEGDEARGCRAGCTLPRTSSYTFKRAFFRAYIAKHVQDPSHLGTVVEGSCPYKQGGRIEDHQEVR